MASSREPSLTAPQMMMAIMSGHSLTPPSLMEISQQPRLLRPKRKLKLKLKHLTVALKLLTAVLLKRLTLFKVSTPGKDLAVLKDLEPLFMVYMVLMVEP